MSLDDLPEKDSCRSCGDEDLDIGDHVQVGLDDAHINAVVTAVCLRSGGVTFEVQWVHNGDLKSFWAPQNLLRKIK